MDPITVLFVDDEPAFLRALRRALLGAPFEVVTAAGGLEALQILDARRVDVLVSDIDMPEMSGLDLVKIVRARSPGTLRMLLTAGATIERTIEAINEGEILRFFGKPFSPELFKETLIGFFDRIERIRIDGELEARRARVARFFHWVEASFPGATLVERDAAGAAVVGVAAALGEVEACGSRARSTLLPSAERASSNAGAAPRDQGAGSP